MDLDRQLLDLYNQAQQHHREHGCSAPPYEHAQQLLQILETHKPQNILEIGTGMGYTAALMALAIPTAVIETLEKDPEHAQIAERFIAEYRIDSRVMVTNALAEDYLPTLLADSYDLIFFDGFQIHYEFLPHYERLLKSEGILVLANNHLKSKTYDRFFEELSSKPIWEVLDVFGDTTVARKLSPKSL